MSETTQFLDLLGKSDDYWHFQTFSEPKGSGHTPCTRQGSNLSRILADLENASKEGAGIFVAVNTFTTNQPRRKAFCKCIRSIFIDLDDPATAKASLISVHARLPPTVTVESSPGKFHVYWRLADPSDILPEDFRAWQQRLATAYGGDMKCSDTTRVMRLPGFLHRKNEPFMVSIVPEYTSGKAYVLDDLVSAFYDGRNNWLTSLAGSYRYSGLKRNEIVEKIAAFNSRLRNPLDIQELSAIAESAERYEPNPEKEKKTNQARVANGLNLDVDKNGVIKNSLSNLTKILEHEEIFKYNAFSHSIELTKTLWDRSTYTAAVTDADEMQLAEYLCFKYGTEWSKGHIFTAVSNQAVRNKYDPLLEYLNNLQWDGTPRLSNVLSRHLGAEDTPYTEHAGYSIFVGAVKRALNPHGARHDEMVVFVGSEGSGKSLFCKIIAKNESWFTDGIGDLRQKDASEGLQGKWVVEFSELRSMQGISSEHTKAFLSRDVDKFRPAYAKRSEEFPRRCIVIGTTNNPKFIGDVGPNRRFVPVLVGGGYGTGKQLDREALEAEIDQLYAEAVVMYRAGYDGWMPAHILEAAQDVRASYTETGDLEEAIIAYLNPELGDPLDVFVPRDFYLTLPGSVFNKWDGSSKDFRQVMNAAYSVFRSKEFSDWEEKVSTTKTYARRTRHWRKK